MAATIQIKRGAAAGMPSGADGELLWTTDTYTLWIGQGGTNHRINYKDNVNAGAAPTVDDDSGDGYSVGSRWCDTTNDIVYTCIDSTVGAAVWIGNNGTVTSVALAMPAEFSVSGSPITTAGTFTVSKANQTANYVYAGPTSGGAAVPAFRALVAADIPDLSGTYATSDTKVKVSVDDDIASYLSGKMNAGTAIDLVIEDPGGNETLRVDVELGTTGAKACAGNDSRLSDARTPTVHASSHQHGGSDELATATAGANAIPKADGAGTLAIGWIPTGTTSSTVCVGNDSRLSDARTPTTHASSHQSGGSDVIKLDDLATPDDNADLNFSTSAHGLAPKGTSDTTKFLRGDASWAVPAGVLDIVGLTATDVAFDDTFPIYDTSAAANRKITAERLLAFGGHICDGRLTTEAGVGVSTSNRTSQGTVYYTPFVGNRLKLYDGTRWQLVAFSEFGNALAITTATNYDVFAKWFRDTPASTNTTNDTVYISSSHGVTTGAWTTVSATGGGLTAGTNYWLRAVDSNTLSFHPTLADAFANTNKIDLTADITASITGISLACDITTQWSSGTARTTALVAQDGILVQSGSTTKLYLGTIRASGSNVTEDSTSRRFVWNNYNRVRRHLTANESSGSWTYSTSTWREINGGSTDGTSRVAFVLGAQEDVVEALEQGIMYGSAGGRWGTVGIGVDSGTVNSAQTSGIYYTTAANIYGSMVAKYAGFPGLGYHYLAALEYGAGGATITWIGAGGTFAQGMSGTILG